MFEKVFKNLINDGIVTKTKYFYMLDNQGDSIYKVKRGYKKVLKEVLKKQGFKLSRDKENKVDIILYDNNFIGCIE